jgi:light-regulated signal transduction histidine kinase (bacteriophytochrome)
VSSLEQSFEAIGLEEVSYQRHVTPKETLGFQQDLFLQTLEEGSYGLERMNEFKGTGIGVEVRKKISEAYKEHRIHGCVAEMDLVCCVGRKPL